jgi:hypothetical protein
MAAPQRERDLGLLGVGRSCGGEERKRRKRTWCDANMHAAEIERRGVD